jgi:antitoxin HicB
MRTYTVVLSWDADIGGYNVEVPALPGCVTQGDTIDEALENAREAIAGFIKALRDIGEPVPDETSETAPRLEQVLVEV